MTEAFFSALPLMLKGDPVITIAPLSWKNSQGESALNLSLFLKDPATTKEAPQTLAQEVDRSVKSLDAKLTIPVDMATELMTQVAKLEGYQEDQAKKLAKQQVEGASAMGQMFRLTTLQDNTITTSLQYANGQITLNGQKMSLEDLLACLRCQLLTFRLYRQFRSSNSRPKRRRFFSPALFLLQHKVILNTHFHIPVIQAIAQRTAIALSRPLSAARKKFIPVTALR